MTTQTWSFCFVCLIRTPSFTDFSCLCPCDNLLSHFTIANMHVIANLNVPSHIHRLRLHYKHSAFIFCILVIFFNLCLRCVNKPCLKQIELVISTITAQRKSRSMQTTHPQQSCPWEPPACPPRAAQTPDRKRPQQWLSSFRMILVPFHTATAAQSLFHLVPALGNSCKNDMTERLIIHTGQSHAYKLQVYNTHPHIQNTSTPTHPHDSQYTHSDTYTIYSLFYGRPCNFCNGLIKLLFYLVLFKKEKSFDPLFCKMLCTI